jgi:lipopolysaccharide transport system ATP-binding protein
MTDIIEAEGLGKRYVITHRSKASYRSLRDELAGGAHRAWLKLTGSSPSETHEEFWALRNVNLRLKEGERLGIVGRNGAGKSTLLKILSRITDPTEGRVTLRGRAASLLEVGTGFHPELTGRENVYLNGAILGMSREEIRRKFDEIVAFAEVERFLDTPVKRYSSGMYVRLAFAVAAHLEPEILIVDEVLAVGDMQFQRKCLGRMEEAAKSGRTILFVSHNMGAITALCDRCIVLDQGQITYDGSPAEGVLRYLSVGGGASASSFDWSRNGRVVGDDNARLLGGTVRDDEGNPIFEGDLEQAVRIEMTYELLQASGAIPVPNFHVMRPDGTCAFIASPSGLQSLPAGRYTAECRIPPDFLNDGIYVVGLALTSFSESGFNVNFFEQGALSFSMRDPMNPRRRYSYGGPMPGAIRPLLEWSVKEAA